MWGSISDFAVDFQNLSKEYNFGAFLDNILKEKCILGINDDRIIEVAIGWKNIKTFQEVFNSGVGMKLT